MCKFVKGRAVPIDWFEIRLGRRDANEIERRVVKRPIAADAKIDAARLDQGFNARLDRSWRRLGFRSEDVLRQSIALRDVENRETLQEGNRTGLLANVPFARPLLVRRETIGVDNGRTALAFAHGAAKRKGLAKRQPTLLWKAAFNDGAPKDQYIDARIAPTGRGVFRQADRRLRRRCSPRLDPGDAPGFDLTDDLGRDVFVEAGPVEAGTCTRFGLEHRRSPRRGVERLSLWTRPRHGKTRPPLRV